MVSNVVKLVRLLRKIGLLQKKQNLHHNSKVGFYHLCGLSVAAPFGTHICDKTALIDK